MKVLLNVPHIKLKGGVANYYKILNLKSEKGIDYFYFNNSNKTPKLFVLFYKYVLFILKVNKYDIIHINPSLGWSSFTRDMLYLSISKIFDKKVIIFTHGWKDSIEDKIKSNSILNWIFRNTYARADAFFMSGTIFRDKIFEMGVAKSKRIYLETMIADDRYINDFSIDKKIEAFQKENKTIKFLFISRITTNKGMILAIDIFNILQNKISKKLELIIAGDGDKLEETKEYVKVNNIPNVKFAGYVKDEEKHKLLAECDITLFPTMYGEGIPNTVLEGMLYGMPIISRVNAGIPDWVQNYRNGFITKSRKPEDYVSFIIELIQNKDLYERISRNNHEIAKKNFTKDAISKRFLEHYSEVYRTN